MGGERLIRRKVEEKDCANVACRNKVNAELENVSYCGECQLVLQDFRRLYPVATDKDLETLMMFGEVISSVAARILGLDYKDFHYYCAQRLVSSFRTGRSRIVKEAVLRIIALDLEWKTLTELAEILGIKKRRLHYLVKKYHIPYRLDFLGRKVISKGRVPLVAELDKSLKKTESSRRSKAKLARSNGFIPSREIASILGLKTQEAVTSKFRTRKIRGRKIGRNWFASRLQLLNYCLSLETDHKSVPLGERKAARLYVESLGAVKT